MQRTAAPRDYPHLQRPIQLDSGARAGTAVEPGTLADLLRTVPREDQPLFQALQRVLAEQLSGVQVYKVGDEAEKEVYIVGKTTDGRWAGLKTTVVET
jgi:hypothetical protein